MKYRDLDDIGRDADDEGWLFWHIVSFMIFFFLKTSLTFFCLFLLCFTNLTPKTRLDSFLRRLTTEGGCIFNVIFLL